MCDYALLFCGLKIPIRHLVKSEMEEYIERVSGNTEQFLILRKKVLELCQACRSQQYFLCALTNINVLL